MPAPLPHQFAVFAQIIAAGNLADCAYAMGLPVESVTETLDDLEQRLGFPLFRRTGPLVELTGAGRTLVSALGRLSVDADQPWDGDSLPLTLAPGDRAEGETPPRPAPPPAPVPAEAAPPLSRRNAPANGEDQPPYPAAASEAPSSAAPRSLRHRPEPPTAPTGTPRPIPSAGTAPRSASPTDTTPANAPQPAERTIVLASHPAIFTHFQEALVAFEEASPDIGITLRLDALDTAALRQLFAEKLADIAYFYALEEPEDFPSRYAWSERISLFVGQDHPLARLDSVLAADLDGVAQVAFADGNIQRALAAAALERSGLHLGPAAAETDNLYDLMKQVRAGKGCFATFGPIARDFGKMPGIARLPYAQGLPQVEVRQAVRADRAADAAVIALAEFLFR